jgi:hypothetical protein
MTMRLSLEGCIVLRLAGYQGELAGCRQGLRLISGLVVVTVRRSVRETRELILCVTQRPVLHLPGTCYTCKEGATAGTSGLTQILACHLEENAPKFHSVNCYGGGELDSAPRVLQ